MKRKLFGSSLDFEGIGVATTRSLLQTLSILRWHKQEERKQHNQEFKAAPAWMISSRHIKSGPRDLPGFVFWRAAANCAAVISPEILTSVVGHWCPPTERHFFDSNLVDSGSASSYFPFLRNCAAMALAGT